MKRLYLLFILATMCVLTTSAQHTRRHSRHRNTAVAQPVETKIYCKKKNGRHATAAVDNKQTTTPVTPLRGRKPTVEKIQYQLLLEVDHISK